MFSPSSLRRFLRLLTLMTAYYGHDKVADVRASDVSRALSIIKAR